MNQFGCSSAPLVGSCTFNLPAEHRLKELHHGSYPDPLIVIVVILLFIAVWFFGMYNGWSVPESGPRRHGPTSTSS